jgi:hypothetical protein
MPRYFCIIELSIRIRPWFWDLLNLSCTWFTLAQIRPQLRNFAIANIRYHHWRHRKLSERALCDRLTPILPKTLLHLCKCASAFAGAHFYMVLFLQSHLQNEQENTLHFVVMVSCEQTEVLCCIITTFFFIWRSSLRSKKLYINNNQKRKWL